jgi:hypothetical protein
MSVNEKQQFKGSLRAREKLEESLSRTVFSTLIANRIPISIADKLARQVASKIDLASLYQVIAHDIASQHVPKQRILDRTIVHMFEVLFKLINAENTTNQVQIEFFNLVPRGECLDLFLQLVKEYCMGDQEIQEYTAKIGPITQQHTEQGVINWSELYQSEPFKNYLAGLLNLILTHLRADHKPIPALENKMPVHFQPNRINLFLNQICKLKKTGKLGVVLAA